MGGKCCNQESSTIGVGEVRMAAALSHGHVVVEGEEHAGVTALGSTSNVDISEELREAEKERLKFMVRCFASNAVRGTKCDILDLKLGTTLPGQYMIDRDLTNLTLQPSSTNGAATILEIAMICDVFREKELRDRSDVTEVQEGVSLLSSEERMRLVVIQTQSGAERQPYCFLEADRNARDNFVTCMNILRLYAEVNQ